MKRLLLIGLFFCFASCDGSIHPHAPETASVEEVFPLQFDHKISIPEANMSLQFIGVLDERCRIGVMCSWSGNAKVTLLVNEKTPVEINTIIEPTGVEMGRYKIELVELAPYPVYEQEVNNKEYTARLKVSMLK